MNRSLKNSAALLAILMLLFAFAGCSDDDGDGNTGPGTTDVNVVSFVTAAGDSYFDDYVVPFNGSNLGVNPDAAAVYTNPTNWTILDFRSATDFNYAHIVGAQNQSLATLVDDLENIASDKPILAVCYTGQTASFATAIINMLGTQTGHAAQNLKFGMSGFAPQHAWASSTTYSTSSPALVEMAGNAGAASPAKNAAGTLPSVTMPAGTTALQALKARAQVAVNAFLDGSAKITAAAADAASANDVYLVNFFSEANYLDGHLDGAILYQPTNGSVMCEFLSTQQMNTLPKDKDIAIYCYTGQTSAQVVAYLQMAGYTRAKTVMFGVQQLAYQHSSREGIAAADAINDSPFHGPEDGQGNADDTKYLDALTGSFSSR